METRVKNLVSSLEAGSDDVRMLGIKGIGGSGKTVLAETVFNHISIWFEAKSFIGNVSEASKHYSFGLSKLQTQVLKDLSNEKSIHETSVSDGKILLKKMMRSRKILLVLDDVDDIDQLEVLAGEPTWFKPGSRIIITTRDEQVLVAHGVKCIYDVNLLKAEEAICLLSRQAFARETPDQGYEQLSREIVHYAAGLPLTLKVLGSFLDGRSKLEWLDVLERLKAIPLLKIVSVLERSYNGLEDDHKEIFLDVACMLRGEKKDVAIRILESCGLNAQIGLRVLEQKSLITISDTDRLLLHDRTEEMGKDIVRRMHPYEPHKHSRLWITEEIEDILVNELGTEATRSIKLHNTDLHADIIMKGLKKMKNLKYLCVEGYSSSWKAYDVSPYLPDTLRCLHWHKYPFRCLPETLADNLVKIEMVGSNISQLWEGGEKKIFKKLKFLNLGGSKLCNLDLGTTPYLKELYLRECSDFEDLHVSAECPYLQLLVLGCPKLTNLNLELIPNLEELYLEECHEFLELHMPLKPPKLTLSNKEITHLPNSICMLKHQKFLELKSCLHLEQLPHDLDRLECLEELYLTNCISLHDIPSSICKMKCLKYLHLPYCIMVKELPEELGSLECLKELNIEGAGVRHLPQSIVQLKGLHVIGSRGRLESYGFTSLKEISSYTASCYI